jgi:hypothetical protein
LAAAEETASPVRVASFAGFPQRGSPRFFGLDVREGLRLVAFLAIGVQPIGTARILVEVVETLFFLALDANFRVHENRKNSFDKRARLLIGNSGEWPE